MCAGDLYSPVVSNRFATERAKDGPGGEEVPDTILLRFNRLLSSSCLFNPRSSTADPLGDQIATRRWNSIRDSRPGSRIANARAEPSSESRVAPAAPSIPRKRCHFSH